LNPGSEDRQTLLVVDDDPAERDLIGVGLADAGYDVHFATGTAEVIRELEQGTFDLVLAGLDLLPLIRAIHDPDQLPVILMAQETEAAEVLKGLEDGANDYVKKPLNLRNLLTRIDGQLRRKRSEEQARDLLQRYEVAAKGSNDGMWDWRLRRGDFYLSPEWKRMLGYEDHEILNQPEEWINRVHDEDRPRLQLLLSEASSDNGPNELLTEHRMRHKSGSYRWVQVRGGVARDPKSGAAIRIAGSMIDITAKRIYDTLTGLPNRNFFMEAVDKALEYVEAHPGWGFTLLMLNLDHYSQINGVFGHASGDQLLVETASRLQRAVRSNDGGESHLVAYLGADEFAVLLGGVDEVATAQQAAGRIQAEFGHAFLLEGTEVYACATIGIALWHEGYRKATEIMRDLDVAIRRAKKRGEAQIVLFDLQMQQESLRKLALSLEVQRGLDLDEYIIYYQPIIRLETGNITGFEGLLRWNHPERGILTPDQFLEHAEETGLVIPIGVFTLRHAAVTIRQLRHRYPMTPELTVGVNISPREVRQPGLASRVEQVLNTAGVDATALILEVNQRVFRDGGETAALALHQVKSLGVRLRLDNADLDPGALRYLSRGLFDSIKISRALVQGMTTNEQSADIVRTLCAVAKGLEIEAMVEGVEATLQAEMAMGAGCTAAQGFLFAPPLTVEEAVEYLESVASSQP
jgi:diguanylate cyclase (GGDEF)-like protein/PAS domain S-box-containing protein